MRRVMQQFKEEASCSTFVHKRLPRHQFAKAGRCFTTTSHQLTPDDNARKPRTIFSGIQPTGVAHLGNYLGAILPWVNIQNESPPDDHLYFSIVDLHSLTSRSQEPFQRRHAKRQTLATLLAAGLDPKRCTLFYQSKVPQHAELYWILGCEAGMGWLSRIPTWKDKLTMEMARHGEYGVNMDISKLLQPSPNPKSEERLKLGLFTYPVLQAADILLYGTTHVPVGEDQLVNIQFAQGVATTFNAMYGGGGAIDPETGRKMKGKQILTSPEAIVSKAKRVMSLHEPDKKMSKSSPANKSRILITDSDELIEKKIKGALTDGYVEHEGISYEPERRPGVSNLLEIVANTGEDQTPESIVEELNSDMLHHKGNRQFGTLKNWASQNVIRHLRPLRENYFQLMGERDGKTLDDVAEEGAVRAEIQARETMKTVRQVIGL